MGIIVLFLLGGTPTDTTSAAGLRERSKGPQKREPRAQGTAVLLREPQEQPQQFNPTEQGREPPKAQSEPPEIFWKKARRAIGAQGKNLGNGQEPRPCNRPRSRILQWLR